MESREQTGSAERGAGTQAPGSAGGVGGDVERAVEQVVLLDAGHRPVGVADKATVHTAGTPLHLAFSCYVLDGAGRLLMTRRALSKRTWPGVWTNSCCGHPAPGEDLEEAVRRRVGQELGLQVDDLALALPDFAYRAVDASGVVENEFCPVFLARCDDSPRVDPAEVAEWRWEAVAPVVDVARRTPWLLSPWSVLQLDALVDAGHLLADEPAAGSAGASHG